MGTASILRARGLRARILRARGLPVPRFLRTGEDFLNLIERQNPTLKRDIARQVKERVQRAEGGQRRTSGAAQPGTGLPTPKPKIKKIFIPSKTQLKRAKSLTTVAQIKRFGRILVDTSGLSSIQLRRARSFTEQKQIREFGKVVIPTRTTFFFKGRQITSRQAKRLIEEQKKKGNKVIIEQEGKQISFEKATKGISLFTGGKGEIQPSKLTIKQRIKTEREKVLEELRRRKAANEKITTGLIGATIITSALRGGLDVIEVVTSPPSQTIKNALKALRHPLVTLRAVGQQFVIDPVGTTIEFIVFSKGLGLLGRIFKRNPVARTVREEMFIRSQPIEIQPQVRAIIKSAKVQEKINPFKVSTIKNVDFAEVKSLTRVEARVLKETIRETNSIVFGSLASRALSKSRTPIPKDVDFATSNINKFNQKFISKLPTKDRKNIIIQGQKLIRRKTGETIYDIKPLNRLIPQRSLLTRRGFLPVSGYVRRLKLKKGSILPTFKKKAITGATEVPTQKIQKIEGIRLVGFGEQTTRKGLGTLQVLIEKNIRRQKDPQTFLIGLEIQLQALKLQRRGLLRNRKIRILQNALKILRSKSFAKLLDKQVPGLIKEFPLVAKINKQKLKQIKPLVAKRKAIQITKEITRKVKQGKKQPNLTISEKIFKRSVESRLSRLPGRKVSILPSRLAKGKPSKLPSKIPSKLPSRFPSKIPTKIPSGLSNLDVSRLKRINSKLSKLSKLESKLSKLSQLPSRVPSSKLGKRILSRLNIIKKRKKALRKLFFKIRKKKRREEKRKKTEELIEPRFIFIPDIASILFEKPATRKQAERLLKKGRIFSGVGQRLVISQALRKRILKRRK